ncbi:unnamed protein product, partial [Sphacelaria rigidula]
MESSVAGGGVAETTGAAVIEEDDAQVARLEVLASLVATVDDKIDFSGSQGGAPIEPFVTPLLAELSTAAFGTLGLAMTSAGNKTQRDSLTTSVVSYNIA